jgi:hypothetical protein
MVVQHVEYKVMKVAYLIDLEHEVSEETEIQPQVGQKPVGSYRELVQESGLHR